MAIKITIDVDETKGEVMGVQQNNIPIPVSVHTPTEQREQLHVGDSSLNAHMEKRLQFLEKSVESVVTSVDKLLKVVENNALQPNLTKQDIVSTYEELNKNSNTDITKRVLDEVNQFLEDKIHNLPVSATDTSQKHFEALYVRLEKQDKELAALREQLADDTSKKKDIVTKQELQQELQQQQMANSQLIMNLQQMIQQQSYQMVNPQMMNFQQGMPNQNSMTNQNTNQNMAEIQLLTDSPGISERLMQVSEVEKERSAPTKKARRKINSMLDI